ncbi:MAG: RDD family protein [Thioalkalispiraceae bacterium]
MSDDQNVINPYQTPESDITATNISYNEGELAGRGTRLGAYILDVLFSLIAVAPMFIMLAVKGNSDQGFMIAITVMVIGLIILLSINIYYLYQNGQTIGKRLLGIKIIRNDGDRASLPRLLFLRMFLVNLIGNIPYIGMVFVLVDPLFIFRADRRCIHDLIADTKVIVA